MIRAVQVIHLEVDDHGWAHAQHVGAVPDGRCVRVILPSRAIGYSFDVVDVLVAAVCGCQVQVEGENGRLVQELADALHREIVARSVVTP